MARLHLLPSSIGLLWLSLSAPARAWDPVPERPATPSLPAAGEDGSLALWRNPANLAFDRDRSYAILFEQSFAESAPNGLTAVTNLGALGAGLSYQSYQPGVDGSWWTASLGLGRKLDRNVAVGAHMGWQLPEGAANNFVTWDLGVGWRPLTWLGFAGLAQNIGDPAPQLGVSERYGAGVALRPLGDRLLIGADYMFTNLLDREAGSQPKPAPEGMLEGSIRAVPVKGLVVRAYANQDLTVGLGLETYFGRNGFGAQGQANLDDAHAPMGLVYLASSPDGDRLFGRGERIAAFELEDEYPYQPATGLFVLPQESYLSMLERLRATADDAGVQGVILHLQATPFSLAQIEEMREVIAEIRSRGKTVVAYLDQANSTSAYLLATAADKVYLHPAGELDLIGLSAELQFFAGTFDLVGVEAQFAKRAEYKGSPEQYTNTGSSAANREQINAMLDDMYANLTESIASGRNRTTEEIQRLIDQGPFTAQEALDKGLVDGLIYADEMDGRMSELFPDGHRIVGNYARGDMESGWRAANEIAVIYVDGVIVTGPSTEPGLFGGSRSSGSETVVRQLNQARREDSVKAVILRVDSPGGSAFASDEIHRAIERLKREDKPVIVSMGGMAASGGYYVSAGADAIYANPSTITGSIGVYSGKFNAADLYEKIGLNVEQYNRGRHAAMYSLSTPMDEGEYAAMDRMVAEVYRQFKDKVQDGRGMDEAQVEAVARGRVWSGRSAQQQGLVDELGGFYDALARARQEAGIPEKANVELITYVGRGGPEGELLRSGVQMLLGPELERIAAAPPLPPELALIQQWRMLAQDPVWAIMPYYLEID